MNGLFTPDEEEEEGKDTDEEEKKASKIESLPP
jgi:hypothetical protein